LFTGEEATSIPIFHYNVGASKGKRKREDSETTSTSKKKRKKKKKKNQEKKKSKNSDSSKENLDGRVEVNGEIGGDSVSPEEQSNSKNKQIALKQNPECSKKAETRNKHDGAMEAIKRKEKLKKRKKNPTGKGTERNN